jgi:hypothetical protein
MNFQIGLFITKTKMSLKIHESVTQLQAEVALFTPFRVECVFLP